MSDLFDDVEGETTGFDPRRLDDPADVTEDDHVFSAGPIVTPEEVVRDALERTLAHLTYREAHAFGLGFAPLFLGLVLGLDVLVALAVPLTVASLGCLRCTPIIGGRAAEWIIKQPHYVLLGQVVGVLLGGLGVAILTVVGFLAGLVA